MDTISSTLVSGQRLTGAGILALFFWAAMFSLLPLVVLLGGMAIFLLVLAGGLAVAVWAKPQEAPGAGMLFLFAAGILLPYSARFDSKSNDISQMYYWASGLFLITAAAITRVGIRRVLAIPRSAQVFLAVGVVAVIYGLTHGATMSYALRQFYGVLLLIVYLGIAYHTGDAELLTRRMATYGVLCAFFLFTYYIAVFHQYGFHKEMGYNGAQATFLAIVLFLTGVDRKKYLWVAGGIALMGVPVVLFMRKDVLTFLVAILVASAMKVKSMALRFLLYCAVALVALPALFPPVTEAVAQQIEGLPVIGEIIPEGARSSESLIDRTMQLTTAMESVRADPWLGDGLGAGFEFESLSLGSVEAAYVDNGWAYLIQKMGLVGAGAFLWLLITIFTGASRESVGLTACLVSAALVSMFSEPVFLHFATAPFLGAFAGILMAKKDRLRKLADPPR